MSANPAREFCKEGAQLSDSHLRLIIDSAIAPEVARDRGYRTITTKAELKRSYGFGNSQLITPTLLIPLYSPEGKCVGWQHRPDSPRIVPVSGKVIKYETPAKSRTVIDVHPALSRKRVKQNEAPYFDQTDVPPLIVDPTVPLFITEGVRKADAAVSTGLCCVALLGVWNWRGTNETGGKTALADWESIALNSRLSYIVFDSDVMVKPDVAAALGRLKAFLEERDASVKLIYLPAGAHGEKVGLDDFIARQKTNGQSDVEIRNALLALATDELRKLENSNKTTNDNRREIIILPGQLPHIVDEAEEVLVKNAEQLKVFQRGTEIVRIISLTPRDVEQVEKLDHVKRPEGAVVLHAVRTVALVEIFDRLIAWQRYNDDGELVPADCPSKIANTYLSRIGFWRLPYLAGVIEAPILRTDGTILSEPGYDAETGLYLSSDEEWPPIPQNPGIEEAKIAAKTLLAPFDQFPFAPSEDKTVLLVAILTALQRRLLESAPLFAFTAPAQRSGKSLLAESIGLIATGRKPAAMSVARDDEEIRKAITSILREGHLITNLDNITRPLDSPDLAKVITQSLHRDRLLGVNETATLPTNVMWTATGNNITFKGDLPSRVLLCTIDAEMERPEEREFKITNLQGYLLEHRKELVIGGLTILRAYHVAGRPKQNVKPWGGFDQWSREIREPIVWLGLADPCRTRERVILNDPDRELNTDVLRQWFEVFGDAAKLTREVVAEAQKEDRHALKQALLAVAAERDNPKEIDPRRFGRWCATIEGRIIDGRRLNRGREIKRAQEWRVSLVSSVSSAAAVPKAYGDGDGPAGDPMTHSHDFDRPPTDSSNSPNSPDGVEL
jgi:Domain of unknown function (DUF3854)